MRWSSSGVTSAGNLPFVPTHLTLLARQRGLGWAIRIALPASGRAEALQACAKGVRLPAGVSSPHRQGRRWSETPEIAAIEARGWPRHVFHSTVCCFARHYLSVPARPRPLCLALLPSRRRVGCGGAEPPSPCSALASPPRAAPLCASTVPGTLVGEGTMGRSPPLIASRGPLSSLVKALLSHFHAE